MLYIGIVIACITWSLQWMTLAWNSISSIVIPVKVAVKSAVCAAPLTNAANWLSSVYLNERYPLRQKSGILAYITCSSNW